MPIFEPVGVRLPRLGAAVPLDPAAGPGLIFETLPNAFGSMAGGAVFGALFFVLLTFAAWTSSIGLIEPGVAWLFEARKVPRPLSAARQ